MFSVVIPLYNKAGYVEKAIRSVLDQTFTKFELIVVNDGSTDDGIGKVSSFTDKRIKLIDQPNKGVSVARNKGAEYAQFGYIAFLDADDWWHPSFLEDITSLVTQYPDANLYGSNYYYVKRGKLTVEYKGLPNDFEAGYIDYFSMYAQSFCVPINCSFVVVSRKAFWQVGGFRSQLRMGEDFDLWARLALLGKVAYLNKPLAYSNQDADPANRAIGFLHLHQPAHHVIFNLQHLKQAEQASAILRQLLDGLRVRSLLSYHLSGQYDEAVSTVLNQVDFRLQPRSYRLLYYAPRLLVRIYMKFRQYGSRMKQMLSVTTSSQTPVT